MGAAPGWEEGELEFKLVFEEDTPPPRAASPPASPGERARSAAEGSDASFDISHNIRPASQAIQPIGIPLIQQPSNHRAGMHSPPPRRALGKDCSGTYESLPARSVQVSGSRVLECPSIQITTISPQDDSGVPGGGGGFYPEWGGWGRERLYLPLDPFSSYRDGGGGSLSPSPASSLSSRSWLSEEASSCESLAGDEDELSDAAPRFCLSPLRPASPLSPGSRPTSPGGKRRRPGCPDGPSCSPAPSPAASRRGSCSDDGLASLERGEEPPRFPSMHPAALAATGSPALSLAPSLERIPQKARKTSLDQTASRGGGAEGETEQEHAAPPAPPPTLAPHSEQPQPRKEAAALGMDYLCVPSAVCWGRARLSAHSPIFRSTALPPLDWPLPSQYDQYELRIDIQPRPHHRAHYETEGSRGAVKATPGGHPVVKLLGYSDQPLSLQMFVGTADERTLRPHPFYQIHRITGKMVGTASQESVQAGTKILDIPLTPENGMSALVDCAGILKLRNSDIELRKGETDVGRKNTRVRLVFRTHVPLSPGRVLSLQTASLPIECSQRSAQELPVVEAASLTSCSVEGGEELVLSGANFLPESKVVFIEKGPDGKLQWEEEALVDRDKSHECALFVQVPAYSDVTVSRPIPVCFYVSNGKRKRSGTQSFKYLPVMFKEEEPLPCPSAMVMGGLGGVTLHPLGPGEGGGTPRPRGNHGGGDGGEGVESGGHQAGVTLPPYPSEYHPSYLSTMGYQDERPESHSYCPHGGDGAPGRPRGAFLERHPSFECLELGLNELMLPQLQRPHPSALSPSPSPWLDSPYLSSSPSPSQASSLSPYPADSPVSSSPCAPAAFAQLSPGCPAPPFEPLPCPFAPESCPPSPSPSLYPLPLSVSQHYFHADAPTPLPAPPPPSYPGRFGGGSCDWDLRQRGFQCGDPPSHPPQPGSGAPPSGVKPEEMPLDFGAPPPITLEEVNEFIGDNLTEFPHAGLEGRPA